jgi:putative transposase
LEATVFAVKTVQQRYTPSAELLDLLEEFRRMVNDCIRIGLQGNATSIKSLSLRAYKQLAGYNAMSYYKACAISRAVGILRNYRKAKRKTQNIREPYAIRKHLVTCYGFKIADDILYVPFKPRNPLKIRLNRHILGVLSQHCLIVRSITLTPNTVGITFSKEIHVMKAAGLMGIDTNLRNVTVADPNGNIEQYDLSKTAEIKARYRQVKSHFNRNDIRIERKVYMKYGRKERYKVDQLLHGVSKRIVQDAKRKHLWIVVEKLTGIRKLYQKGNGQGVDYRARFNSWSFAELQRQIEYKALWEDIRVIYVDPNGTSAKCSICGQRMKPEENRMLRCRSCGFTVDRDVNAAKNILARGMRFVPVAPQDEAMQMPLKQGIKSIVVS